MKTKIYTLPIIMLLFLNQLVSGQGVFHNYGNLQIHQKGSLGFHSDLINDGMFDKNLGFAGFYQEDQLLISGAFSPVFYDFETAVENDLFINVSINISNSLNFIYGNIKSTRNNKNVYVQLLKKTITNGLSDHSKVNGYASIDGQKEFSFPIGHKHKLRPLSIRYIDGTYFAKCAYFYENPNNPESIYQSYDTRKKDMNLGEINSKEFWNLNASGIIQITLSWDTESELFSILQDLANITVVGWSKENKQWDNLGNALYEGDITEGWITSNTFNANNYEIFTIGSLFESDDKTPGNYALTPNGDGINDQLIFEITIESPKNNLQIFDRSGRLVYEKSDYRGEFGGRANTGASAKLKELLPTGVYFYLLELNDLNRKYQGYFYLAH